ncbi:MAG: hypothetical protein HOO86_17235 [Bacteroidales bacterium]|nr:hypothetical protein [Bacteroidales bacterium]
MKLKTTYVFLFIACFCGQTLFSQNESIRAERFSIGTIFAPQFSNWTYHNSPKYQTIVDLMDSIYTTKDGFSFGFVADFYLDKRSSVKSGILTSLYPIETIVMIANSEDPIIPGGRYSFSGIDYFIDIPLIYKYSLYTNRRVNLFLGTGVVNKFLFYTSTKSFLYNNGAKELMNKSGDFPNFFTYFIAASVEAGIEISITERINFGFFPSFEYSVLNVKKDREITRKYSQIGLNTSISYKFN